MPPSMKVPMNLSVPEMVSLLISILERIPPEQRRATCERVIAAVSKCKARCPLRRK